MLIQDLQAQVLVCTPSYALHIAEVCATGGVAGDAGPAASDILAGSLGRRRCGAAIEREFGMKAFNNYGLSEVIGPGVSGECTAHTGMHIQEDHFLVECLNPETLEPVKEGEPGELVFTTLTKQAMPVIRYRTRDIAALHGSPCECGRTGVRMSRVIGRTDDMLIIRGVNVFPSQVEEACCGWSGTAPHYLIEVDRPGTLDEVVVKVEMRPQDFSDEMRQMQHMRERIGAAIFAVTGVHMKVELAHPQTLERSQGKAKQELDLRKTRGL